LTSYEAVQLATDVVCWSVADSLLRIPCIDLLRVDKRD